MTPPARVYPDSTIRPKGGLQGYVTASYATIVKLLGAPNSSFIDDFKMDVEWLVQTPDGPASIYNWKPELPPGIAVEKITDWHVGGESRDVVQHVVDALTTATHAAGNCEPSWGTQEAIPQQHNGIDLDVLADHLLTGEPLFVPGGQPDHSEATRNEPFSFVPAQPIQLVQHPLNPGQTPVVGGELSELGASGPATWYVALAHLAHARGACGACESVWREADAAWAEIPAYADGAHASLFAAFAVESNAALLVHVDDVPADFNEQAAVGQPRGARVRLRDAGHESDEGNQ